MAEKVDVPKVVEVIEIGEKANEADETKDQPISKKRKLFSKVWKDFEKLKGPDGNEIAKCKHCKKQLVGENSKGTSHLKSHLKRFHESIDKSQQQLSLKKNAFESTMKIETHKFNQERSRINFATMLIKHNYPFNVAEHEFFKIFCNGLQPSFKLMSRNTVRSDILTMYQKEKGKLYNYLDKLPCKVAITTDLWTSDHQKLGYICLTTHFIDNDWELKKKIIAYKYIKCPHDAETLFKCIIYMVMEWNIDGKLFAMVVDNATTNDAMLRSMKSWLCDKSLLPMGGDLFHVRCSAHILNLIVQDGLMETGGLVYKVRESVKYVTLWKDLKVPLIK